MPLCQQDKYLGVCLLMQGGVLAEGWGRGRNCTFVQKSTPERKVPSKQVPPPNIKIKLPKLELEFVWRMRRMSFYPSIEGRKIALNNCKTVKNVFSVRCNTFVQKD